MKQSTNHPVAPFEYQNILREMVSAYALHEIIVDTQGIPIDYRFLEVNPAFEQMTGLNATSTLGKTVRQIMPAIDQEWIDRYGRVALSGQSDSFQKFSPELDKYFQVSAFCPQPGYFAITFNDVTPEVETVETLQFQNRVLKRVESEISAIYQNTPILMFVINSKRRIVKINQATANFAGLTEQQAMGLTWGELFKCVHLQEERPAKDRTACDSCLLSQNFSATLRDGKPRRGIRATLVIQTDLGPVTKHLLFSTTPLVESDPQQVLVCIHDISPFVEEHELRIEGDARYRALVEEGFDGILIHRHNRIIYLNQQMADILGYQKTDLFGKSPLDFVAPGARDFIKQHAKATASKIFEIDLVHKDGRSIRVETLGVNTTYQGEPANIVAVRDVSSRAEADEKLRLSEQLYARLYKQFESLLNAISDPIALLTADLTVLWTNQAYEQLRTELKISKPGLIFPPFFEKMIENPILDCLASGRPVESLVITPDQRIWEYRAYPLNQDDGTEPQVLSIVSDISEKLRLREEANRTSRLAALGELAAGVAHEINNPNALILYNSDMLQGIINGLLDGLQTSAATQAELPGGLSFTLARAEVPTMLGSIHRSAQRIKQIVDDLRNFSQSEENPQQELIDLNQVVEAAVRLTSNTIKQHTHNFSQILSPQLPCILGNSGRLEQVVINLLLNACQALDNPSQQIQVETSLDKNHQQVLLKVTDQGRGIDSGVIERLSEPFFTTRRERGGTGLGLSVSSRIVKEHSGHLSFAPQPPRGTLVTLRLPLPNKGAVS